jgi:hypothetical protein
MPDSGIGSADHPTFDVRHGFPNRSSRSYSECAGMKGCDGLKPAAQMSARSSKLSESTRRASITSPAECWTDARRYSGARGGSEEMDRSFDCEFWLR